MPVEILMPELGESVHEATVTKWLVKEGDTVKEDDPVVEIMTDKVNTELPAPASGVLSKILVLEGGTVKVFGVMGVIEESDGAGKMASALPTLAKKESKPIPKPLEEPLPQTQPAAEPKPAESDKSWLSPVVRAMAKEHGISEVQLSAIKGTGAGGRVSKRDLEEFLSAGISGTAAVAVPSNAAQTPSAPVAPSASQAPPPKQVPASPLGPEQELVRLPPLRKMIAEAMVRSSAVPTVSTVVQVDVTSMVRFREANKDAFLRQYGVKLTYTPFFVKALTESLLEFPTVNGSLNGDQLTINHAVHMGIAVALGPKGDEGLIVPVIRDCHKKHLVEIARALDEIANKARSNALSSSDVQGGTFTLSNPGSYGALFGTPMIVMPQAAIAGAYGIQKLPVVTPEDAIAIRSMMYLALTYDHRVIDGLLAGRFLQSVKKRLETFNFFA